MVFKTLITPLGERLSLKRLNVAQELRYIFNQKSTGAVHDLQTQLL